MYTIPLPDNKQMILFISTQSDTPVSVIVVYPSGREEITIAKGQNGRVEIAANNDQNAVVKVSSTGVISINSFTLGSCSSYLALTTTSLATEYYVMTWSTFRSSGVAGFTVTSDVADNTVTVEFAGSPSQVITWIQKSISAQVRESRGGDVIILTLGLDESVSFESGSDLTGTHLIASASIAVYGGNSGISVGISGALFDNIESQYHPTYAWGREHIIVPVPETSNGYYVKILAMQPNTLIRFYGFIYTFLSIGTGDSIVLDVIDNSASHLSTTEPVMVIQYVKTPGNTQQVSAPAAILVPPVEQYKNTYDFVVPQAPGYQDYVMLVAKSSDRGRLINNGQFVDSNGWVSVPESNMFTKTISAPEVFNEMTHNGLETFGAFVYGVHPGNCAFGFPAGMNLFDISDVKVSY